VAVRPVDQAHPQEQEPAPAHQGQAERPPQEPVREPARVPVQAQEPEPVQVPALGPEPVPVLRVLGPPDASSTSLSSEAAAIGLTPTIHVSPITTG